MTKHSNISKSIKHLYGKPNTVLDGIGCAKCIVFPDLITAVERFLKINSQIHTIASLIIRTVII